MSYLDPQTAGAGGAGGSVQSVWQYDDTTTAADPGSGNFRLNNTTIASATAMYISDENKNGADFSVILNALSSNSKIYVQNGEDASEYLLLSVTSIVDNTGWFTINFTVDDSSGPTWTDGKEFGHIILLSGSGGGGGSNTTNLGETDMTSANTFDETGWPDDIEWFEINFWDVDMPNSAADITLRLRDTGLVTTGYDSHDVHISSAGTRTHTSTTIRFAVNGFSGTGIVRGHMHGRRLSSVTDRWAVHGTFLDEDNDETVHFHGNVDLGSDLDGIRIQSANVGNFTAGFFSISYGV